MKSVPSNFEITALILLIVGIVILTIVTGHHDQVVCQQSGGHIASGFVGDEYVYMCVQ